MTTLTETQFAMAEQIIKIVAKHNGRLNIGPLIEQLTTVQQCNKEEIKRVLNRLAENRICVVCADRAEAHKYEICMTGRGNEVVKLGSLYAWQLRNEKERTIMLKFLKDKFDGIRVSPSCFALVLILLAFDHILFDYLEDKKKSKEIQVLYRKIESLESLMKRIPPAVADSSQQQIKK
jgi:hypothetical protein